MDWGNLNYVTTTLILFFGFIQTVVGIIIAITTGIVSSKYQNKYVLEDLKENKEDHASIKQEIVKLHKNFENVVRDPACKETRRNIQVTFCRKIDSVNAQMFEIKTQMHEMDNKREEARSQVDKMIGLLQKSGSCGGYILSKVNGKINNG